MSFVCAPSAAPETFLRIVNPSESNRQTDCESPLRRWYLHLMAFRESQPATIWCGMGDRAVRAPGKQGRREGKKGSPLIPCPPYVRACGQEWHGVAQRKGPFWTEGNQKRSNPRGRFNANPHCAKEMLVFIDVLLGNSAAQPQRFSFDHKCVDPLSSPWNRVGLKAVVGSVIKTTQYFPEERFSKDGFANGGGAATDKQRWRSGSDLPLGGGDPAWLRLSDVKCHSRLQPAARRLSEEVDSKVKNRPAHSRRRLKVTLGCEGAASEFSRGRVGAERTGRGRNPTRRRRSAAGTEFVCPSVLPSSRSSRCFFSPSLFLFTQCFVRSPHCGSQINFQGVNLSLQSQSKALWCFQLKAWRSLPPHYSYNQEQRTVKTI